MYLWEDPLLFKICVDQVVRRCVPKEEYHEILSKCHSSPYGGHFRGQRAAQKVLQSGFFSGLHYSKTTPSLFKVVIDVKELETSQGGMKWP